ncbi:MAG: FixH family protein [Hydrogenophilales bacterium]|nr:FixH family protein [Hydrogenophilales bacterium]
MYSMNQQRPWYRDYWPWFLIALPASAVVAGFITLWLAIQSDDGVVVDDYYKQGLAINRTLARDETAARLQLAAHMRLAGGNVELTLSGRLASHPDRITLRIAHPTRAGMDQTAVLTHIGNGRYTGHAQLPAPGRWTLVLEDPGKIWLLHGRIMQGMEEAVTLKPKN